MNPEEKKEATSNTETLVTGDIVYLKSGSPAMTLGNVLGSDARVIFWNAGQFIECNILVAQLTKVQPSVL